MSTMLLFASALIPAFLILWYLCSRDANREPPALVIRTFLLGALITVPIVPVAWGLEALGGNAMGMWPKALVGAFLGAAIPEELFKFAVLRFWVWKQKDFDEPMDGIVYGAAASLGFAALENVLYVSSGGFGVATLRAVTAVPCHALSGVLMGYYAGRAKFAPREEQAGLLARGVGLAVLTHGLYDTFLLTESGWAILAVLVLAAQLHLSRERIAVLRAEQLGHLMNAPPASESPRVRTPWGQVKIVIGTVGTTAAGLFLVLCLTTAWDLEITDAEAKIGLAIAGLAAAGATFGFLNLFRSGLQGPFTTRTALGDLAPPGLIPRGPPGEA